MKMVKSLLLGSAAGLVAMAGAQAADLPVKAKPVQYVKICSLYGAGFYYIPGTDTCLKVGGWVRMQMGNNFNGNMTTGPLVSNLNTRNTNDFMTRNRGYITADARTQTSIGTVRSYIAVGLVIDNPLPGASTTVTSATAGVTTTSASNVGFNANRAFIQFSNFTAGLAQSFYDFVAYPALSYYGNAIWAAAGTDTGDGGQQLLAYTAQLGNGLSASLSLENARNTAVQAFTAAGTAAVAGTTAGLPTTLSGTPLGKGGNKYPDIVLNLRVDQAWGSAQIMGAIHDASAAYTDFGGGAPAANTIGITSAGNKTGYAIGAGAKVLLPMLGAGDYVAAQFNYTVGASRYASAGVSYFANKGASSGSGTITDGDYLVAGGAVGPTTFTLTKSWSIGAGYEHNWNSSWKTSVYGGYLKVDRDDTIACSAAQLAAGCSGDFSTWQVGSRTQWAPAGSNLEIGLDIIYDKLNARNTGTVATSQNQDAWIEHLRIQRNFLP